MLNLSRRFRFLFLEQTVGHRSQDLQAWLFFQLYNIYYIWLGMRDQAFASQKPSVSPHQQIKKQAFLLAGFVERSNPTGSSSLLYLIIIKIRLLQSLLLIMAGDEGFEPPNGGTRTHCLTTWRIPNDSCDFRYFSIIPYL